MQPDFQTKRHNFQVQIRKQNINKILGMRRIRPKLIHSDMDALTILVDGLEILKNYDSSQQQKISAMKSITESLKKYEFKAHTNLLSQIIHQMKFFLNQQIKTRQIIKESAIQLVSIFTKVSDIDLISFQDLPFYVLSGYNLQLIKYCLISLTNLLDKLRYNQGHVINLMVQEQIMAKLNQLAINHGHNRQCFEYIKIPFLRAAIILCYIDHQWNIKDTMKDTMPLLKFSVEFIEKQIIQQFKRDQSLQIFFNKKYDQQINSNLIETSHQISYPFSLLELIVGMIKQVNTQVLDALVNCLSFQIRNLCVQKSLAKCLIKIYNQTQYYLPPNIRQQVFGYIFGLQYHQRQESGYLREILLLAVNESVNHQSIDQSIFKQMGDPFNKDYPHTHRLLTVMVYLRDRDDQRTQQLLLELVQNYINYNGSLYYLEECVNDLSLFKAGRRFLRRVGFELENDEEEDIIFYEDGQMKIEEQDTYEQTGDVQI